MDSGQLWGNPMNMTELREKRSQIVAKARKALSEIQGNTDEKRAAELEKRHDALMSEFDDLDAQIRRHERTGMAERVEGSYRSGFLDRDDDERRARLRPNAGDGEGGGVDNGFSDVEAADADTVPALRSGQSFGKYLREKRGLDYDEEKDLRGLTTGGYLRSMFLGAKTDVERRALAEGSDSAGGYTVPEALSAQWIDRMRAASSVFRAGALTVPLESNVNHIAKVATDPVPTWRLENSTVSETEPTFTRVTFTPKSLAVMITVSRELLQDSLNIGLILPDILASAMAQEIDRVALFGSGTGAEPRGVANFAGLTSNAFAGGPLTSYAPLIKARTALRTVNSDVTAYIMSPRDDGQLAELVDTTGQPINMPPAIARTPMLVTSKVPTNLGAEEDESIILAGEWSRLMIGIRSELQIEVLREAFATKHQYAFVAHLRADIAAEHEAAFTKLSGLTLPA